MPSLRRSTGRPMSVSAARQQLPPPNQRNCWFGKRCHRPGCPFAHPSDDNMSPPSALGTTTATSSTTTTTPTSELSSSSPASFQPVQPRSLQQEQPAVQVAPQQQKDVDLLQWTKRLEEQTGMTHIPFAAELEENRPSNVTSYLNPSALGSDGATTKPANSMTTPKKEPEYQPFHRQLVSENIFVPSSVLYKASKNTTPSSKKHHSTEQGMPKTAPASSPSLQQTQQQKYVNVPSSSNRSRGRRRGEKGNALVQASGSSGPAALQQEIGASTTAAPTHAYSSTNNNHAFMKVSVKQPTHVVQQPQSSAVLHYPKGGSDAGNRAEPVTSQQSPTNKNYSVSSKSGRCKQIPEEIGVPVTVLFAQQQRHPETKSSTRQPHAAAKKVSSTAVPSSAQQQQQQQRSATKTPADSSCATNATTTVPLQAAPTSQEEEQEQLARALAESLRLAEYYQAQQNMTQGQLERFEMAPDELQKFKEQRKVAKKARRKKQQQESETNQASSSDASWSGSVQSEQEGDQTPQQAEEKKDNDSSSAIVNQSPTSAVVASIPDKASTAPASEQDEQEQLARAIAESLRLANSSDRSEGELKQGQVASSDMTSEELEAYKKQRKAAKKARRKQQQQQQQQQVNEAPPETKNASLSLGKKDSPEEAARAHNNIATPRASSVVSEDNNKEEEELTEEEKKRRRMEQFRIQQENAARKKREQKEKRRQEFLREQENQANERKLFWQNLIDQEVKAVQLMVELCAAEFCRKNVQMTSHGLIELEREKLTAACQKAYHKLYPQFEVVVKGVTGDLKDRTGTIEYFDEQTQKFVVALDTKKGKKKFSTHVLPENLEAAHHGSEDNKKTPKVAMINISFLHRGQGLHFELEKHLVDELLHAERPQDVVAQFVFQRHQQESEEERIREEMKIQEEEERQRRAEQRRHEEEEYAERRRQYEERKHAYEEARRQAKRESKRRQQHFGQRCHCPRCEFMRMFAGDLDGGPFGGSGFGPRVFFTGDGGFAFGFGFDDDDDDDDYDYYDQFFDEMEDEDREQKNEEAAALLEVDVDAGPTEIRKQYYKLAKKYHPDKYSADKHDDGKTREEAEEHFKHVQNAYDHLMSNFDD